jgi:hypothetical protein
VVQGNQIVVLKMPSSATPDPMAREPITQIGFPLGASVEATP